MSTRIIFTLLIVSFFSNVSLATSKKLHLKEVTRYTQGVFGKSAAEIIAYSPVQQQFYLVNGSNPSVDILKLENGMLVKVNSLSLRHSEVPTSVAVSKGLVAVAVHEEKNDSRPGKVIFFTSNAERIAEIPVGDLPDMVTFALNGNYLLTAITF